MPSTRQPVLLVGIAGGTASGKTTLARRVLDHIPDAVLIGHDRYYHTVPDPARHNYDEPSALDSDLLARHLDILAAGGEAAIPSYDFTKHRRKPEREIVRASRVVLVEGILVLAEPQLRERFGFKVWVEAPEEVRLERRIRRDQLERGRSVQSIMAQYQSTVRPSHLRWVQPSARHADLVLDGTAPVEQEGLRLCQHVWRRLDAMG